MQSYPLQPYREKKPLSDVVITGNPILDRIYQNRGISSPEDVNYQLNQLIHPYEMKGIKEAADLLIDHIAMQSKIIVVGDYDCDGATSTSIAVEGLKLLGAKNVDFIVPDRMKHGYGLTPGIVKIAGMDKPDLIITVDNGIASFDGAEAVKELEHPCQLLVTDHHLTAKSGKLPNADVIVNPNQPGCNFPSKSVAGCGVIFYVILGLRARMHEMGAITEEQKKAINVSQLLDLVALGTVADVVPLDKNNRILVQNGLKRINRHEGRPGIRYILEQKKRKIGEINSMDFGFAVGPCINAAGRLDDMAIGIRCLLAEDDETAKAYAVTLAELNERRKSMTEEMTDEAIKIIENENLDDENANGVCLYGPDWHEGVVGILAGRVKERVNRPVICFTNTEQTTELQQIKLHVSRNELDRAMALIDHMIDERTLSEADIEKAIEKSKNSGEKVAEALGEQALSEAGINEVAGLTRDQVIENDPGYPLVKALQYAKEKLVERGTSSLRVFDRLVERFGEIKGSCRSIEGIHLKHVLDEINKQHPEILQKFGGHAMAAGLTIGLQYFEQFRKKFDEIIGRDLTEEMKLGAIEVDVMDMRLDDINSEFIHKLKSMGPFGAGFPSPFFGMNMRVVDVRILKDRHAKLVLEDPKAPDSTIEAIQFNCVDPGKPHPYRKGDEARVFFEPDHNAYRGPEAVQLMVRNFQNLTLAREQELQHEDDEEVSLDGIQSSQKNDQKTHITNALGG